MKLFSLKTISGGTILIGSTLIANVVNLAFNAYLGRNLSFEDFALVSLINTFWYIVNIFVSAYSSTVNHRVAYLNARKDKAAGTAFLRECIIRGLKVGVVLSIIWLIASPFIEHFFDTEGLSTVLLFTPAITLGFLYGAGRGFLNGNFQFIATGVVYLTESLSKLLIAVLLVSLGLSSYTYIAIPASVVITVTVVVAFILNNKNSLQLWQTEMAFKFPRRFYIAYVMSSLSSQAFLTVDMILAKHFMDGHVAGEYALLALVGKMIYFLGSLMQVFLIPFVSRAEGEDKNPDTVFYRLFAAASALTLLMFVFIGAFGGFTVPLIFGAKALTIVPYLIPYCLAIALFTMSMFFVNYHLLRHQYSFPIVSIGLAVAMAIGISLLHSSIAQIVNVILTVSGAGFVIIFALHILQRNGRFLLRNLVDLIILLLPSKQAKPRSPKGKRILIFNWRDLKHVYAGGSEVYIHELATRWVESGNIVTVFCGNDGNCARNDVIDGVHYVRRGGFYFIYVWAFLYYLLKFRGHYDIIIDTENGLPFFTPLYAKEKIILLIHHVHQEVFTRSLPTLLAKLATFLELKLMPYAYKHVQIITVSASSRKEIIEHKLSSLDPIIINPGIDTSFYVPGKKSKRPTILYLGRLKKYKSVDILIKAMVEVVKNIPTVQLIIAGDGEERQKLQQLIQKLDLASHITVLGKISAEKKLELYQQAWVFANPSFMEGWGITSIEASACGTPVVASNVAGLRDSVKENENGYLVQYGDVGGFSTKISSLLRDTKTRETLSRKAVLFARSFDWSVSAEKGIAVMEAKATVIHARTAKKIVSLPL